MHFTREPTVETVITPREGCKLVVRSSRGSGSEEFFVDALEVVVFGNASFFRSLERPKAFLLPVSDYEVLEVRETRMVLKAALGEEKKKAPAPSEQKLDKKRERRRQRRRGGSSEESSEEETAEEEPKLPEPQAPPQSFEAILPPPSALISEQMSQMKPPEKPQEKTEPELVPPEEEEKGMLGRLFGRQKEEES